MDINILFGTIQAGKSGPSGQDTAQNSATRTPARSGPARAPGPAELRNKFSKRIFDVSHAELRSAILFVMRFGLPPRN